MTDKQLERGSLELFSQPVRDWFTDAFGAPTDVQNKAWPAIAAGRDVLVSAPTGTGKTLSAFLIFIDRLNRLALKGELRQELYLIYISPLKSLAGDIRENLRRPLDGIVRAEGQVEIETAIRTGDTPQKVRQRMIKHPPHILITTPESLYLMLSSRGGRTVLGTARAVIIDELHALIDTKRGAHLMLSIARLDRLCGQPLQRIGLSATIEPLALAAEYLSPEKAVIAAPPMNKKVEIQVIGTLPAEGRRKDPVWEELAVVVYEQCLLARSVIAFSEGRRYAEKLAYYVNLLGGDGFARVHHGSLAREQRDEVEAALRDGRLRLLCATSSMELGIDVGDIDKVLQIGCPRTVSSTMQRLGRAGHNPNRVSVMYMYPRTAPESIYCGMTAETARKGGVEEARPPRLCLDILAQHLVSMAATQEYTVEDVMGILQRAWPFTGVTERDVADVLRMLAGDYEHSREIPARPRILYDRIHGVVSGDPYSRMLAVAAGGTIPDKGLYTAKTEDGVKLGELDEEFVYESRIGDKFVLGSFAWKILRMDRETVVVTQVSADGARLPFWKGETKGRDWKTSMEFGRIMRRLEEAILDDRRDSATDDRRNNTADDCRDSTGHPTRKGRLFEALEALGLDQASADTASGFLKRQMAATGGLPNDKTILVEHFTDHTGCHQVMVHALFGRRVNAPLSLLIQRTAMEISGMNVGCVDDEDGFLLFPYGSGALPERLLYAPDPDQARQILETILPETPLFNMTFRYSAARALMMGMKRNGRQPLWMQRLKSTELLDMLVSEKNHPLIRETRRECLEDLWDIDSVVSVLHAIRSGLITVREVYVDTLSPMSLPCQWQAEASQMYEYSPTTPGIRQAVYDELKEMDKVRPAPEELARQQERTRLPENEDQLHSLLMIEGDIMAGELPVPVEWLEQLAGQGLAAYIEPGLWIAAEHLETYEAALVGGAVVEEELSAGQLADLREKQAVSDSRLTDSRKTAETQSLETTMAAAAGIVRRMLYYRGGQTPEEIQDRYLFPDGVVEQMITILTEEKAVVEDSGVYYHAKLYDRARKAHLRNLRHSTSTQPPEHFAALMAGRAQTPGPSSEQLAKTIQQYCGCRFPVRFWESVLFSGRVKNYTEAVLDRLLAEGDYFWNMYPDGTLSFHPYEEIDWDAPLPAVLPEQESYEGQSSETAVLLDDDELRIYQELKRRGASFLKNLTEIPKTDSAQEVLLRLAEKGLVCADSFVPVRQWQNREKIKKAAARQRVGARVMALSAGRWDIVRPRKEKTREEWLELFFRQTPILCRETFRKAVSDCGQNFTWPEALESLRIWEYTGRVRRGYFASGLSGAQFIRKEEFEGVTAALQTAQNSILWMNATDPAMAWGKYLAIPEEQTFLSVAGTAVALQAGRIAAVMERQGKLLRMFDNVSAADAEAVMTEFVGGFKRGQIFPGQKRLILKEYPEDLDDILKKAGFIKEMRDYVLYR